MDSELRAKRAQEGMMMYFLTGLFYAWETTYIFVDTKETEKICSFPIGGGQVLTMFMFAPAIFSSYQNES